MQQENIHNELEYVRKNMIYTKESHIKSVKDVEASFSTLCMKIDNPLSHILWNKK